jgi:hypothetical protein
MCWKRIFGEEAYAGRTKLRYWKNGQTDMDPLQNNKKSVRSVTIKRGNSESKL